MHESMSYSEFRASLKSALDMVCEDHIPLLVTRKNGEDVVIISKEDYKSMDETAYLLSSPKNAERLMAALNEPEEKRKSFNSIEELEKFIGIKKDEF